MSLKITSTHNCMILDACCVMNLYASGKMEGIISSITESVAVTVYVMDVEALTVYEKSKSMSPDKKELIDLQPFLDEGCLFLADLDSNEEKLAFIQFAALRLDDGEAMTLAIASSRNWAVATDDRAAQRIIKIQHKHIQTISTPEIIRHWNETTNPEAEILRQAIINIEQRANYLLGKRHPLFEWWQSSKKTRN
ncbi:MAG: hypothetical protein GY943_24595 [Chloroflexi bacterium]|nr:hypothetical protein [Chloroflexota bacterium]